MKNRESLYPGRVKLTPVDAANGIYDMIRADEPQEVGTPLDKKLLDFAVAACGVTAGTATAYTLDDEFGGFELVDGAKVNFGLHVASGVNPTLNVNGTGAKALKTVLGDAMPSAIPAGMWVDAKYSAVADAYILSGSGVSASQIASWEDKPTQNEMLNAIDTRSAKIVTGTYTGNNAATVTINLDFTPYIVYVFMDDASIGLVAGGSGYTSSSKFPAFFMMALRGATETQTCGLGVMPPSTSTSFAGKYCLLRLTWGAKSLKWTGASSDYYNFTGSDYDDITTGSSTRYMLNYKDKVYRYIAIGRS